MFLATSLFAARGGHDGPPGLFFLLLLVLLIGSVVWFVRRRGDGGRAATRSALHTLQERFAAGEMDQAEYDHRRAVLTGADHVPPAPRSSPGSDEEE